VTKVPPTLPPRKAPTTVNRLRQLLTELEKQSGIPVRRLNLRVSSMMLAGALSRLNDDQGQPVFIVKGGVAIELRLQDDARTTRDVDVILIGDPETLPDRLEEAFEGPYEGFEFIAGEPEPLELRPHIRRVMIQVLFNGKNFNTLQVEVAPDEAGADEFERVDAHDLSKIGLKGPDKVPVLRLPWQIAQKLHAVTEEPQDDEKENIRYWDLIDLQLLEALAQKTSIAEIREACEQTFAVRDQQAWPPVIKAYASWAEDYTKVAEETAGLSVTDVNGAVSVVQGFVDRIAAA